MSGYEVADNIASGVERAVDVGATIATKIYAVVLIALGIFSFFLPGFWWGGFLFLGYGIYLIMPGEKWVIW